MNDLFSTEKLGLLLKARWTDFIDSKRLMLEVMKNVHDAEIPEIQQDEIPKSQTIFTITDVYVSHYRKIDIVVEYTIPKEDGVVVGTHVYSLDLNGSHELVDSYATWLRPRLAS